MHLMLCREKIFRILTRSLIMNGRNMSVSLLLYERRRVIFVQGKSRKAALSGTPSAAPMREILLPTCAVPGQTAPCATAWAQTPHDTYSPNWNALTFGTFPT